MLLKDANLDVVYTAACAAGQLGEVAARSDIVDKLVALVVPRPPTFYENRPRGEFTRAESVQRNAALALSRLGVGAMRREVLPTLNDWLHDERTDPRLAAAEALAPWMPQLADCWDIIDRLFDLLRDVDYVDDRPTYEVCTAALYALLRLKGTPAERVLINRLRLILAERNWYVGEGAEWSIASHNHKVAGWALNHFKREAARPDLIDELLRTRRGVSSMPSEAYTGWDAARNVVRLGAGVANEMILDRLAELLRHPNPFKRRAAAVALGGLGAAAATAVIGEGLGLLLLDAVPGVRNAACEALGKLMGEGLRLFTGAHSGGMRWRRNISRWQARTVAELSR
jgi:HEAT repeat protein